ncbi:MAG: TolC family protein [Bryobacteraceae bacterium]
MRRRFIGSHIPVAFLACSFVGVPSVAGQSPAPQVPTQAAAPVPAGIALSGAAQSPFSGGVPSGPKTAGTLALALSDAIGRGLKFNLGLILGAQGTRSAEAARLQARSALLPNLSAGLSYTSEQEDLKALGFTGGFPGIPTVLGPFGIMDARAFLTQQVLNVSAIQNNRAGSYGLRAAQNSYQDARDIVVQVVASLYLAAVAGYARIDVTRAQVDTAQALYRRASDMKDAGTVAGIDVLRAQVELQAHRQRLIFYRNEFEKQKLALARVIGLPIGQAFDLADPLRFTPLPEMTVEQGVEEAYRSRFDYRAAQALVSAAEASKKAAQAERYPSLGVSANYGDIGNHPGGSHGTYTASAGLTVPIFEGGRSRGDVLQADSLLERRKSELEDLRSRIDYEIRTAFLDLRASNDQVQVARSARDLATEQLKQAQDRFSDGVANSVEVVQAQEAMATADENYIASLFAYNASKVSLARALGNAEKSSGQLLEVGAH